MFVVYAWTEPCAKAELYARRLGVSYAAGFRLHRWNLMVRFRR